MTKARSSMFEVPAAEAAARVLRAPERLDALRRTGLIHPPGDAAFDHLSAVAARLLRVPVALVTLVADDRQFFTGCRGLPEPWATTRESPLAVSFCQHVVATGEPLAIADAREHPVLRESPAVARLGGVAYLGIPLVAPGGSVLGSFCAIDRVPRPWTEEEVAGLTDLARWAAAEVALRLERTELLRVNAEREEMAAALRAGTEELERRVRARTAELRETLERLRRSETDARQLFERAGDGVLVVDPADGRVLDANPAACELLGAAREALVGGAAPRPAGGWRADGPAAFQAVHPRGYGGEVHLDVRVSAMERDGRPALLCTCRDVTPRIRAEAALRASEERFRSVVERMAEGLVITDLQSRIVYANPRMEQIFGWRPEELLGQVSWQVLIAPEDRPSMPERIPRRQAGERERYEVRSLRRDGTTGWIEVAAAPFRNAEGEVVGTLGAVTDVTERRRIRDELERSLSLLRATLDATTDGILALDLEGRAVSANQRFLELWEVPGAEDADHDPVLAGARLFADPEAYLRRVREMEADPAREWFDLLHLADGRVVERTSRPQRVGGRVVGRVLSFRDVTERARAEQALHAQRTYLRAVLDALPNPVWAKDLEGRFTLANRSLGDIYGVTPEELLGRTDADFNPIPEEVAVFMEGDRAVILGGRQPVVVEEPITHSVSGEVRWYQTRKVGLRPPGGGETQVLGIGTDITDRLRTEEALAESQRQLLHSQKMEAVGRLAGGIAHDFNNMLMAIGGHAELLRTEPGMPEDCRWQAEEISKAADRAAGLTRQLLAFSRKQVMQPRALALNAVVSGMEDMLRRLLGETVDLRAELAPGAGVVKADPGQLEQVLMNLAVNARDAMPAGGTLTVETGNVFLDAEYAALHEEAAPGAYVVLTVSDTGTGMDATVRQRIFEPFFTTKPQGRGTGLGLSTVYGIVHQSGGHVWVHSEVGVGTTFRIYLPREDAPYEPAEPMVLPPARGGQETVLLAEDDGVVRELLRMFLARLGYRVLSAAGGEEALEVLGAEASPPDLLLTDVVMPGMGGRELARKVREAWPRVAVIFMSGYTDDAIAQHGVLDEDSEFIQKPVSPDLLAHRIRAVLDPAR